MISLIFLFVFWGVTSFHTANKSQKRKQEQATDYIHARNTEVTEYVRYQLLQLGVLLCLVWTMVIYFSKWLKAQEDIKLFSPATSSWFLLLTKILFLIPTNMIHKSNLLPPTPSFSPGSSGRFLQWQCTSGSGSGRNAAAGGYSCCHRWQLLPVTRWRTPVKDFFQMLSGFPKTAARLISSKWDLGFQQ